VDTKKDTVAIGCISNKKYSNHAAVMLHSLIDSYEPNINKKISIYFIDLGISNKSRESIKNICNTDWIYIEWIKPDKSMFSHLSVPDWQSHSTYYKLILPKIVYKDHERLIYLDVDMVIHSDITDLWSTNLDGNVIGAVQSYEEPQIGMRDESSVKYYQEIGYRKDTPMFNAGLLLIDLKKWISNDISAKVVKARRDAGDRVKLGDQDGLNIVLHSKWKRLDRRWNVCYCIGFDRRVNRRKLIKEINPLITHYLGSTDPMDPHCRHPVRAAFLRHLRRSGYYSLRDFMLLLLGLQSRRYARMADQLLRSVSRPFRRALANLLPASLRKILLPHDS